jgi:hypothetical protein
VTVCRGYREQGTDHAGLDFSATDFEPNLRGPDNIDCKQNANDCPSQGPLDDGDLARILGYCPSGICHGFKSGIIVSAIAIVELAQ